MHLQSWRDPSFSFFSPLQFALLNSASLQGRRRLAEVVRSAFQKKLMKPVEIMKLGNKINEVCRLGLTFLVFLGMGDH